MELLTKGTMIGKIDVGFALFPPIKELSKLTLQNLITVD